MDNNINDNPVNSNQPIQSVNQAQITPPVEPRNSKLVKVFYVFGAVVFMAIGAFGYGYFQNKKEVNIPAENNLPTQTPPTQQVQPTVANTTPIPTTISNERIYRNEKYNFQFSYPQDRYFEGKLSYSYKIEEKGSQIIITETIYRTGEDKEDFPHVYTIYGANTTDKNNLTNWWQQNIKIEIGSHRIPTDYNTALNSVPFDTCITEFDKTWKLPSSLEVTPKEGVEEPGPYKGSIYFYYDFGKPFIMNFTEESTGACGGKDSYLMFTSMSKLH
jgi:hypothetical protein